MLALPPIAVVKFQMAEGQLMAQSSYTHILTACRKAVTRDVLIPMLFDLENYR